MGLWYATHVQLEYRLKAGTRVPDEWRSDPVGLLKQCKEFLADARTHMEVRGTTPRTVLRQSPEMKKKYGAYDSAVDILNAAPQKFQEAILRCSGSCRLLDTITQEAVGEVRGGVWVWLPAPLGRMGWCVRTIEDADRIEPLPLHGATGVDQKEESGGGSGSVGPTTHVQSASTPRAPTEAEATQYSAQGPPPAGEGEAMSDP